MTSQRNKKQEHKNEKVQGSHWIMGDGGSRGAPCRSHDITSCHAAHAHVRTYVHTNEISTLEMSTLEMSSLEITRLEMSFWK